MMTLRYLFHALLMLIADDFIFIIGFDDFDIC